MSLILLSRGVRPLRNGNRSAKEYPYWDDLANLLIQNGYTVEEVKEMPLPELKTKIETSLTVIATDSFIQHFCWSIEKKAVVLWGVGDPNIFGHKENINLIKSRNNLRPDQFGMWEHVPYRNDVFVSPEIIVKAIQENFK